MEDHTYNSMYYGNVTIKCTKKVWDALETSTCEVLAALINGDRSKVHQSKKITGNPGDGYEGYVHAPKNQLASFKDVEAAPGSITVLKVGKVNSGYHVF